VPRLRVAAAQVNATVGDLAANTERIVSAYEAAETAGADLVAFPELAVTGYPPEDLLIRPAFVAQAGEALEKIAARTGRCVAVIGFPVADGALYNAAAVCGEGSVLGVYRKRLLPNYSVFDEQRYFTPGTGEMPLFDVGGVKVGVSVCEDIWSPTGPVGAQAGAGAELAVNINASPYYAGRLGEREAMLATRASAHSVPILYVNLVGGQDELVFDGASMVFDAAGRLVARARQFAEDLLVVELDDGTRPPRVEPVLDPVGEVWQALVLGTRDYVRKNGFREVVIGLSGGIDSALVTAIAAAAIGPEHVVGVRMPSRYSSPGSLADAAAVAENLGIRLLTVPIEEAHTAFLGMLSEAFTGTEPGLAEENIQARIRGTILMALSNKFGWLVLTTGNKSEMATGYSTLYGDMAGGFAVIKDVEKTLVYEVARWRNRRAGAEVIPAAVLEKAPSAELRPGQVDADSLPPYDLLDPILEAYVEGDLSVGELEEAGYDHDTVRRVARLVDRSEYKRRQAPPGVRVSPKAFGKDRRLPITNRWPG
jgi:NAD+ synthase (glutamine-hydrolysing)